MGPRMGLLEAQKDGELRRLHQIAPERVSSPTLLRLREPLMASSVLHGRKLCLAIDFSRHAQALHRTRVELLVRIVQQSTGDGQRTCRYDRGSEGVSRCKRAGDGHLLLGAREAQLGHRSRQGQAGQAGASGRGP